MTRLRGAWRVPVLAALGALALFVAVPARTSAQGSAGFGASSSAFGARVSVTISKAPLVPNIVDGGGPLAQTTLDSLGTAMALASFPYPGDVVLNLPGLAAGLGPQLPGLVAGLPGVVGANVPGLPSEVLSLLSQIELPPELVEPLVAQAPALPPYPFAAQADALNPEDEVDLGVGKLTASSAPDRVAASATSAPGASGAVLAPLEARSTITQDDDGGVLVEATGSISGLRVGPIVLGAVTSSARMERTADGDLEQSSSFRASGIQVGALTVDLTPDGFEIGGTPVAAPIASTINGLLASAGIELRVLPSARTAAAVVAGGLELVRQQDFGPLGTGSISIILGQSSATLNNATALPTTPAPTPDAPTGDDAVVVVAPPSGTGGGTPLLPSPTGVASPRTPVGDSGTTAIDTRPAAVAEDFDASGLYLLLILAAAVIVGIGPVLRVVPSRAAATPAAAPR